MLGVGGAAAPMSGILRSAESLTVQELLDDATYDNAFILFDVMGFGRPMIVDLPTIIGRHVLRSSTR